MNILEILQRLFKENRVPSAILIKGDLADARLFVKSFLQWACCETHENCGTCPTCLWLQGGHHPDVMEIMAHDTGHAIKIEQVRELLQWAHQSPTLGHRWGIIDDAGGLNSHSANALLKVLEEPTLTTHFILTVDNECILPDTILSRCVRFDLPRISRATDNQEKLKEQEAVFLEMLHAYFSDELELAKILSFFEPHALDDNLWFLQQICADVISKRLQSMVPSDKLAFAFAVPLASWWKLWDALLTYRKQFRLGVRFHEPLLISRLLLLLKIT